MKLQNACGIAERAQSGSAEETARGAARVAAVIVLYYPDAGQLQRLAASVTEQVDLVVLVDNTPGRNGPEPAQFKNGSRPLHYLANGTNQGIATAQNVGIERSIREGCTHVLLLDQDSALPENAVANLLNAERELLQAGKQVAAVGPQFIDEKDGRRCCMVGPGWIRVRWHEIPAEETNPVECDYLIASGSLIRTCVLSDVGWMRDELFIDWVDAEWAYRAKSCGYSTYIVPTVIMLHSIGEKTGQLLGQRFNLHAPARNYYIVRNAAYLLKERRMSWRWRVAMVAYIPKYILVHGWLSQHPGRSMLQMLRAVWEGLAGNMRPYAAA